MIYRALDKKNEEQLELIKRDAAFFLDKLTQKIYSALQIKIMKTIQFSSIRKMFVRYPINKV